MTANSVIEEIKDRLDVATVVGRYVALQKSGNSYRGLCPFHSEKTPSLHVFPHTNTWKCFGCGAGGDIFNFVEKKENLPFPDVLRMLAAEAGVQLEQPRPEVQNTLNRLRELHTQATSWFQSQLLASQEGKRAREYLARRQINQETIEAFQLGYARDGWEHLIGYLRSKGFSLDEIIQAGLAIPRESGGAYDRFRNRLIIPIRDLQGRVIAFGGRILDDGEPKYLNSPQTPLFDKSRVIFALDMAKRAIRAQDQVVLVEGYMDVISAHQRGFKNVVAAMGTSITAQQIKLLSRYTDHFVFALDADAAGARATWRGVQLMQETLAESGILSPTARGFRKENRVLADVGIAIMPEGQDPDDVLRQDPEMWRALIENALPVVDYTFQQAAQQVDFSTAAGKAQFVQQILPTLHKIGDPVQRRHYISKAAVMVKAHESDIEEALRIYARNERRRSSARRPRPSTPPPSPDMPSAEAIPSSSEEPPLWDDDVETLPSQPETATSPPAQPRIGIEEHLLSLILFHHQILLPWLDDELGKRGIEPIFVDDFAHPLNRTLFDLLEEFYFDGQDDDLMQFMSQQDAHIQDHFLFLWDYASTFESLKPKHIQFHHLQRDIVTNLLRLRLEHSKETQRQLEISLREASEPDELDFLGHRFQQLLNQRRKLEQSIAAYSQTARWINSQRSIYVGR